MPDHEDILCMDDSVRGADAAFADWLQKTYAKACRKERVCRTHMDDKRSVYGYHHARRMKRCVTEAATYEAQAAVYKAAVLEALNILGRAMERNELPPALYNRIKNVLQDTDIRRRDNV